MKQNYFCFYTFQSHFKLKKNKSMFILMAKLIACWACDLKCVMLQHILKIDIIFPVKSQMNTTGLHWW